MFNIRLKMKSFCSLGLKYFNRELKAVNLICFISTSVFVEVSFYSASVTIITNFA